MIVRQRPPTAKGFTFLSVEDETGISNFVITPQLFELYRRELTGTALVLGEDTSASGESLRPTVGPTLKVRFVSASNLRQFRK